MDDEINTSTDGYKKIIQNPRPNEIQRYSENHKMTHQKDKRRLNDK